MDGFHKKEIAAAISAVLGMVVVQQASSAIIDPDDYNYDVAARATTTGDGETDVGPNTDADSAPSTATVGTSAFSTTTRGTSGASSGTGNAAWSSLVRASGNIGGSPLPTAPETYFASASYHMDAVYTNTTGADGTAFFSFLVERGSLSAYAPDAGDTSSSSYALSVFFNGSKVFGCDALLSTSAGSTSFTDLATPTPGAACGIGGATYGGGNEFNWDSTLYTLNLGTIAAGDDFTLSYDIAVAASGSGMTDVLSFLAEDGEDNVRSGSRFGDPGSLSLVSSLSISPVPIPSTALLLIGGFLPLAWRRRQRDENS